MLGPSFLRACLGPNIQDEEPTNLDMDMDRNAGADQGDEYLLSKPCTGPTSPPQTAQLLATPLARCHSLPRVGISAPQPTGPGVTRPPQAANGEQ